MGASPFQPLGSGKIFAGRYRIERFLAQGGYGSVFVAEQLATDALVALKVLRPNVLESAEMARRFQLEAKIAGRVRSDFIVRMLDAGVDEETRLPFLVMELLEGESLATLVRRDGPLGLADAALYLSHVAHGLEKAHGYVNKQGKTEPIVHRDLKPENLFLTTREDGQRVVRILDFGVAKVLSESTSVSRDITGTPLFMAYEQAAGAEVSPATDIWAFGLLAFFLLTGRSYWRAAARENVSVSAVLAEILHQPLVAPSERARELGVAPPWPPAFDAWFSCCVDRRPSARFATPRAALGALLEALLGSQWSDTFPTLAAIEAGGTASPHASTRDSSADNLQPVSATRSATAPRWSAWLIAASLLVLFGSAALVARSAARATPATRTAVPQPLAGQASTPPDDKPARAPSLGVTPVTVGALPSATPMASTGTPPQRRRPLLPAPSRAAAAVPSTPSIFESRIYSER